LGILHRLLSFEKQNEVQLGGKRNLENEQQHQHSQQVFKWEELWGILINTLKYLSSEDVLQKVEVITLTTQVLLLGFSSRVIGFAGCKDTEYVHHSWRDSTDANRIR
jgi:hypothetical protein